MEVDQQEQESVQSDQQMESSQKIDLLEEESYQ